MVFILKGSFFPYFLSYVHCFADRGISHAHAVGYICVTFVFFVLVFTLLLIFDPRVGYFV